MPPRLIGDTAATGALNADGHTVAELGFKLVRVKVYGIDVAAGSVRLRRSCTIGGTSDGAVSGL
ncbi:hypothetical protein [Nonomuraea sp. NPDC048916]|uniref:hypothetical protein n=1 Tax=Nonomuraea sp. NPDC048916 TaxID=3154232 RepID=UPI0033C92D79